jgi:transcription termination factor Rho
VTETIEPTTAKKRGGGLNSMLLADLKQMAGGMGIAGAGKMKKAQLVEAIKAAQAGAKSDSGKKDGGRQDQPKADSGRKDAGQKDQAKKDQAKDQAKDQKQDDGKPGSRRDADSSADSAKGDDAPESRDGERREAPKQDRDDRDGNRDGGRDGQGAQGEGRNRNRRRRGRDRNRPGGGQRNEPDTTVLEDDVLVPAAGILDVLDNYAFVRTSGYLPGPDDVYLSLSMVRKFGLRRGDAIVGQVRQPREGERKEKFNPMVRIDSVNGADPEQARTRVEFAKLTPLYPSERLRLETEPTNLIGRVIDIAAPIGKGQRGLIVSPAKAGKTMIMQSIANSITTNNPECHLMVVLVDERPEEVTDFERSVKGEVISSTFDRPAADHTIVAELAIERAKRLVELGHDVVVLLDGITRLGRAYNLAAPASGRILSGGVDSAALYPPKKFFGAARNIENGGSLTILATALIESGSKMDEVIFEEFKGTGNMEIRLRRDFADKRLFPAIDAVASGTRREELLMSKDELAIVWKLRRVLSGLDGQQALEVLLERLKKTSTNIEFLMQVQKTTPTPSGGISED